jgi:hypothetical protein
MRSKVAGSGASSHGGDMGRVVRSGGGEMVNEGGGATGGLAAGGGETGGVGATRGGST